MTPYDYLVVCFYLAFMIGIGVVFRRFSKTTNDYFRGGGSMLWWMTGAATIMSNLSVWSFTGAAGSVYKYGAIISVIWLGSIFVFLFVGLVTAPRFRQMRVVTSVEAIRRRYGAINEQFYVWLQVPRDIFSGATSLTTLGIFVSVVFKTDMMTTILVVGSLVIVVALFGGAWAVAAGGFVQMLLMFLAAVIVVYMSLYQSDVGGFSGLIARLPKSHLDGSAAGRPEIMTCWTAAIFLNLFLTMNDMSIGASKYLAVKDGSSARKAAIMASIGFLFLPLLLVIPPLCTSVLIASDSLTQQFHKLPHPEESAYVAISLLTLPHGMLGLLVCGIFAAAIAGMDAALNRNAGVIVKNFYCPILRPHASDRELLLVGKGTTLVCGLLVIVIAVVITQTKISMFNLVLLAAPLLSLPLTVPLFWGIFIKRTPAWSAWSTSLVSFAAAWYAKYGVSPEWFQHVMGWSQALTQNERDCIVLFTSMGLSVGIGSIWYFLTLLFSDTRSPVYRQDVDRFFADMQTPIDAIKEGVPNNDARQYRVMGLLCLTYGVAMVLGGVAIPNQLIGRLCFLFVAAAMLTIAAILLLAHRRVERATLAKGNGG